MLATLVAGLSAGLADHTYTHKSGFLSVGGDAIPFRTNITLDDAIAVCSKQPDCKGLTFQDDEAQPDHPIAKCYFKNHTSFVATAGWQTYLRDYVPPPPLMCTRAASNREAHARTPQPCARVSQRADNPCRNASSA